MEILDLAPPTRLGYVYQRHSAWVFAYVQVEIVLFAIFVGQMHAIVVRHAWSILVAAHSRQMCCAAQYLRADIAEMF